MRPNVTGIYVEGRRGGGVHVGDLDRELVVGDDRGWIHRRVELLGFNRVDPIGWITRAK